MHKHNLLRVRVGAWLWPAGAGHMLLGTSSNKEIIDSMSKANPNQLETDSRFPSGPWTGYFLDERIPGRHLMELHLVFASGSMTGEGRDWVGKFAVRGRYTLDDGKCYWTKRYVGRHDVFYDGFNEGKGIWGTWELTCAGLTAKGGFHIWPEGMEDPTGRTLKEEADVPAPTQPVLV